MSKLPTGWAKAKLAQIAFPDRPRELPTDYPHLPFVGMEHVEAHSMRLLGTAPAGELKSSAVHFQAGDVLYGRLRPYLNKVLLAGFEGLCSAEFIVFAEHEHLNSPWLAYFLNSSAFVSYSSHLNAGDRPRVDFDQIGSYELLVAPRPEQDRIVAEIEKQFTRLDAATSALKRVQANLKRYRASVLKAACDGRLVPTEAELARREGRDYEPADKLLQRILRERRARWEADTLAKMIAAGKRPGDDRWKQKYKEPSSPDTTNLPELPEGWCWASLGQLTEIQGGIQKQPSRIPRNNAYPFLRVANVLRGKLDLEETHQIELFEGELDRLRLEKGDLLIVEGNGSPSEIGRMAAWSGEIQNCVHQNHIIRARPMSGASSQYLMHFWNSPAGASQVLDVASSTSGLHTLSVSKISRLAVPLPPEAEQERIAEATDKSLQALTRTQEAVKRQHERATSVRQSILKDAFSGQLVPRDPTDEPASALLERIRAGPVESSKKAVARRTDRKRGQR